MLNVKQIESFKKEAKAYKRSDSQGLFLFVTPSGNKLWRMAYRFAGKQKELSIGSYPEITLAKAREKRDDARRLIANGTDPGQSKQETKRAQAAARTFGEWCDEWLEKQKTQFGGKTLDQKQRSVSYLKDEFGKCQVSKIMRPDVVLFLREFEADGMFETRDRARAAGEHICAYADLAGTGHNPFQNDVGMKAQLMKNKAVPRPALIKPDDVAKLMRSISTPSDLIGYALR
jgi:hypothetical protein